MDFSYTEEQLALEDTLRRFVAKEYSFEQRRGYMGSSEGFSRTAWKTYAELGILALPFPDEFDGLNGTALDTMLVMRALGNGLTLEPYLATVVLCGGIINMLASPQQKAGLIPAIGDGSLMLALAHYEPQSRYCESAVDARATRQDGRWQLTGHKAVVLGAASADHLLVSARTDGHDRVDQLSLFLVASNTSGLSFRHYDCHDGTRAADIVFDNVLLDDGTLVGREAHALPAIMQGIALANVAMSAEAAGIMQSLNAATLDYLKTRKQFGVPLGSFQALQHRMADMAIAAEQADSMALLAAIEMQNPDADVRLQKASGAKAFVAQKARLVGHEAIQMHGGIGVTDELMVGHYFKRLTTIASSFGDVDFHLQRYSDTIRAA
ncbi:pimeloyl-CoA dehydrogenase small subunit [Pollutimonas nitritireducens]|uniref:Pimeloyl-CoA dehydrogenase small subunit n=1 Tax=Pollutimonas nitritireducens TaxID=2045209 RepID=A0A2N4UEC7_9BURK|nr:acyl-CoA dehydrogenase family protein [Pollutimonas nitritireducens]PLC53374.1 pimeloyl-CoA dehydrogenase small subunit [Pollutimonas nitritireducens]